MAASILKRNEAVVWLPPRMVGERAFATEPVLRVGMRGDRGLVVQQASIEAMPSLRQVRLVFDARDINLLEAKLPPLAGARLRQALPNALEDRLLQDPQACMYSLGPLSSTGTRTVSVLDRAWFDFVVGAFERRGMRVLSAVPGQLSVPLVDGADSLLCIGDGLALRTGQAEGIGWPASEDGAGRVAALGALLAQRVLQRDLPPPSRLLAYIDDDGWRTPLEAAASRAELELEIFGLPVPPPASIELMQARGGSEFGRWFADLDWRAWRWPALWACAAVLVFLVGLNLHWGRMLSERKALHSAIEQAFRETFPKVPVVVDPILQMDREMAALRTRAGQSGPSDFVPLLARLAQALGPQATGAMSELQYRDGKLSVRFAPALTQAGSAREQIVQAARRAGLRVEFAGSGDALATVSAQ